MEQLKVSDIDAGHIALAIWNGKSGPESKMGVKHLYSEAYEEKWPRDEYPEYYKDDDPVD